MAAGDVTITAANKALWIARCKATQLNGGSFESPEAKCREIASLIMNLLNSVTAT